MGDRRHIGNAADLETHGMQTAHGGITTRPRPLHEHLDVLHAEFMRDLAGLISGHLRGEGRALARTLETASTGGRPRQGVALTIGDGDDGVVEGRLDMRHRVNHIFLHTLTRARSRFCHSSKFPVIYCSVDYLRTARRGPLRGRAFGTCTLTAHRQTTAMTQATIAAEVHQTLDVHGDVATKIALDLALADFGTQGFDLRLGQLFDLGFRRDTCRLTDLTGTGATDAVNGGQGNACVLLDRNIDPSYAGHSNTLLKPLALCENA